MTDQSSGPLTPAMIATLEHQRLGFVATVSPDGLPMVSPKGTFVALGTSRIAFGEIRSPQTIRNLRDNPAVEVNFVDPLSRKGFRARGNADIVERGTDRFEALMPNFERWGDLALRLRRVVVIDVTRASELTSPAYDNGADEDDLRRQWAETLLERPKAD